MGGLLTRVFSGLALTELSQSSGRLVLSFVSHSFSEVLAVSAPPAAKSELGALGQRKGPLSPVELGLCYRGAVAVTLGMTSCSACLATRDNT